MKVFIITEGQKEIGFGHITRCTSIYQAFLENKIAPKFIINGDEAVKNLLDKRNYELFNWLEDKERLFNLLRGADIAIIDSYLADDALYQKISKLVKLLVYLDDNNRIEYPEGIVINGTIYSEDFNYSRKDDITYLLGSKYIPLRKVFWNVPEKKIKKTIEEIIITFGGDDSRNMTPKTLELLNRIYPNLIKNVIVGKGFQNIKKIERQKSDKTNLIYYPEVETMKKIMLESDIAISACGQTLYELARVGIPTIGILVDENQMNNANGWQKAGFIEYLGRWDDIDVLTNIQKSINLLNRKIEREARMHIGKDFVDGKGAHRIIEFILDNKKLNM